MTETQSLAAICSDFYVNQKLALKLDLPTARESVLDLFDRIRKEVPSMDRFRRYDDEVALESTDREHGYEWMALDRTAIRSGRVNPPALDEAYRLHRLILETAPWFLSISPLDVDFVELMFGFDLEAERNRNDVVFDALVAGSPLADLVEPDREPLLEVQPFVGFALNEACTLQAYVEVKTRTRAAEIARGRYESEPISVYLTVRQHGPFSSIEHFTDCFGTLAGHAERLAEERVIPSVVVPLRAQLLGG